MQTVILVSCVSKKRNIPSPARDLYLSDWFTKAADYAGKFGDRWFILSAKYGLVAPDKVIEPYDLTLKSMSIQLRRAWAMTVLQELRKVLSPGDEVILLAGKAYREFLIRPVEALGCRVSIPMEGLRIGEQMQWLNNQLKAKK